MEWIAWGFAGAAFVLVLDQMDKLKKLEKRVKELEGKQDEIT